MKTVANLSLLNEDNCSIKVNLRENSSNCKYIRLLDGFVYHTIWFFAIHQIFSNMTSMVYGLCFSSSSNKSALASHIVFVF